MSTTVDDLIELKDAAVAVALLTAIYLSDDGRPKPPAAELRAQALAVAAQDARYDVAEQDPRCSSMADLPPWVAVGDDEGYYAVSETKRVGPFTSYEEALEYKGPGYVGDDHGSHR